MPPHCREKNITSLAALKEKIKLGENIRIAFFGESTTRSGHWTYLFMNGLRDLYSKVKIYSSNVAVGGEGCLKGIHRLENEVLSVKPDLVIIEYLINDSCSGNMESIEKTLRKIIEQFQSLGINILIVTNNGMNPYFSQLGSS